MISLQVLTKKKPTLEGYIWPLATLAYKDNGKFEILLVKIFSLKQKSKSNSYSYYRKI